ncbi:glucosidase II [Microbotryomycetes sp. JL221]|nr:glucosidase II [Microbotryomycetes sp. JL221]
MSQRQALFGRLSLAYVVTLWLVVVLSSSSLNVTAVKRHDFKTCQQSGFCRRNRALADRSKEHKQWRSPYSLHDARLVDGQLTARVSNALYPNIKFKFDVRVHKDGVARVVMDEVDGLRQRYNEAASWAFESEPELASSNDLQLSTSDDQTTLTYHRGRHQLVIKHNPILLTFYRDGQPHIILNEKGLLNMEHFRVKQLGTGSDEVVVQDAEHPQEQKVIVKEEAYPGFLPKDEDGMWEESFGGKADPKPKGKQPTMPFRRPLSPTSGEGGTGAYTDPYRLYNLDVFEYDADSEMAIYGAIPFMKAHRAGSTTGVFFVSASETWIDITKASTPKDVTSSFQRSNKDTKSDRGPTSTTTTTHWMAESGILDLLVFLGPSADVILDQYTSLTGRTPLPQFFATAYHQCRWNYLNQQDVQEVQTRFDEADIPMDVMWLDIEYAEEHQYFVWDRQNFPEPEKMQDDLAARGRKLVAIVDPHIKRNPKLYIYKEAQDLDILVKTNDGKEFEGWCWTGSSAWTDWFNPKSWQWWIEQFKFEKFKGSTKNLFIWNDMNEPSIFNGPEITMQKDAIHHGGWEHRDVHNINGMIYHNLTAQGLIEREEPRKRPFVLTRAFYAGSQRFGAMWTGDNLGDWAHLQSTVPMLLTNGVAGMTFAGSDVGGFFGNPGPEMLVRWYQVGAFSPFFRAHGHIDTKRREPYLFDQPYQGFMRDAIRLRYSLLPALYTAFWEASLTGKPIMRPQYMVFPQDSAGFSVDDQFYFGSTGLLVKPVVHEGQTDAEVYIADDQPYYHYATHNVYFDKSSGGGKIKVDAPLGSIPVFHRGGSILPRRDLIRRSSILSWKDPITLVVAVDKTGRNADGSLYLDDGESYGYETGEFVARKFQVEPKGNGKSIILHSRSSVESSRKHHPIKNAFAQKIADVEVREIVVLGLDSRPSCIKRSGSTQGLEFEWIDGTAGSSTRRRSGRPASKVVIKDAKAPVIHGWDIVFEFDGVSCATTPAVDYEAAVQSPECPVGQFQCRNEGHIPSCILRSRVNDGICDPECCDGSDETDGKVLCPNVCQRVGYEHKRRLAEEARKVRVGASIRKEYIAHGQKEKAKLEAEMESTSREIVSLRNKEQAAKAELTRLESEEADDIERKKDSLLYQKIVDMQEAIKALRLHRVNLEGHISDLSGILSDLSRDFNPNYQDMAVLGAARAFKQWQVANGLADPDDQTSESESGEEAIGGAGTVPPSQAEGGADTATRDFTDEELEAMEREDPLALIDSLNTRVGKPVVPGLTSLFRIDDYLPDRWRPKYDDYKRSFIDVLVRTGIIYQPSRATGSDRPELARARATHTTLVDEIGRAESKLSETKQALEKDWGQDWEWKKLDGACIDKNTGEYTYSVCFFGEATQKSNNGGGRTSLGHFKGWSETESKNSDAYYHKQLYADGQRCWNGPARSAKVDLVCGTNNALLSVTEPEKCIYLFKVSTPAICKTVDDNNASILRDEL